MTNKPNVNLTETDLSRPSLDDQMRESWEYLWSKEDEKLLTAIGLSMARPHHADAPVFVLSGPTSPNKSHFYEKYMRNAFPRHQVWDEAHVPVRPFEMHEHQRQAMEWFNRQPTLQLDLDAFGGVCFDFESVHRRGIGRLPMIIDPWMPEGVLRFTSGDVGQSFIIDYKYGINLIADEYIAPAKMPKDWDKNAQHWYKAAMGGKPMMNMAIAAYRASKHSIYQPEFDWENQREARRKLHFIKHVNVGTVGHIDWGNNRLKRTRPYVTGYLADCIREAIKEFK